MTTLASITCATDGSLRTFDVDGEGITPRATSAIGSGISALAPDASGGHAFAGVKEPAGIVTLGLEQATGAWQRLAHTGTEQTWTYLSRTGDGRFLLGASYGGGVGRVWPIEGDRLAEHTAEVRFENLHCVIERDRFVYFASLGEDLIACFRLADDGTLAPLEVPTVPAPEHSGPRHLVIDAAGDNLYCVTEFSGEVVRYARDAATGTLERREAVEVFARDRGLRHSEMGADPVENHYVWGADVHLWGDFLVASERCESTLVVLPVAADGALGDQLCLVDTEQQPRGFAISADGLVVCPGEKSEQVSLFRLDDRGGLSLVGRAPSGTGGNWVRFTG